MAQKLLYSKIRVEKSDSAFVYFTLEANEGLAFYSTDPKSQGKSYRDLDIYTPLSAQDQFNRVFESLKGEVALQILTQEELSDS